MSGTVVPLPPWLSDKIVVAGECWLWQGYCRPRGYGEIHFEGRTWLVHRLVYVILEGNFPADHDLHHREMCPHKNCVNPAHLEPLTKREHTLRHPNNNQRWRERMASRTHCSKGHELTPENTRHKRGRRICRTCERVDHRIQQRAYRARKKEELSLGQ